MRKILALFLLIPIIGNSQHLREMSHSAQPLAQAWNSNSRHLLKMHPSIPADTSFNIHAEFRKQVKQYPHISPAEADTTGLKIWHDIVYTRYGKRELHLDLFAPAPHPGIDRKPPLPVVLLIHGGGWQSGDKSMDWPLAAALAQKGFITVCAEYRLSTEALYPAAVTDLKTAIRWIRHHAHRFGADPSRIALMGTSAGGHLAALIGTINDKGNLFPVKTMRRTSGKVQAVVDIDGILAFIHPESGEGADKPGKPSAATLWFGGNSTEKRAQWTEASPLSHPHPETAPFLFINSSQPRFHAGRDDFSARLDSMGISCEIKTLENTPHTFWLFNPWFPEVVDISADFLERKLKAGTK